MLVAATTACWSWAVIHAWLAELNSVAAAFASLSAALTRLWSAVMSASDMPELLTVSRFATAASAVRYCWMALMVADESDSM